MHTKILILLLSILNFSNLTEIEDAKLVYKTKFQPKIEFDKEDLKLRLTPMQYETTQEKKFEGVYRGIFVHNFQEGKYHCIVCDEHLFNSEDRHIYHRNDTIKFGGWASFDRPTGNVVDITERYKKYDKGWIYNDVFQTENTEA